MATTQDPPAATQAANAAKEKSADIFATLRQFFELYFDTFPDDGDPLNADLTKVHVGIYSAYDPQNHFPVSKPVDASKPDGPSMPFSFRLMIDTRPVSWVADGEDARVDPNWKPSGQYSLVHLWHSRLMFDPVFDDLLEMRAVGFPYAEALAALSAEARQIYGSNLNDIIDVPEGLKRDADGPVFIKSLALHGTYDAEGNYFAKWKPGRQNKAPLWDNVTEQYFSNSAREVQLPEDCIFVMRQNELSTYIDILSFDAQHGTQRFPFYSQRNARYELTTYQKNKTIHDNFVFVYSVHGAKKWFAGKKWVPKAWNATYAVDNPKGHAGYRRMVDVPAQVQAACDDDKTASDLGIRDEFEWFVEWVRAIFPNRITVYDLDQVKREAQSLIAHGGAATWLDDTVFQGARTMVHEKIVAAVLGSNDLGGPITDELLAQMRAMLEARNLLVLPQGLKTGEHTRFVGGNEQFMYERDLRNGSVYSVASDVYIRNLYIGQVAVEVYEATRGMIPVIQAVVWAGVAVMGLGVLEISPWAIRAWVVREAERQLSSKLIMQVVWKFFRPGVIALMVELIAYIFKVAAKSIGGDVTTYDGDLVEVAHAADFFNRVQRFAQGFFRGYVVNTITDRLYEHVLVDTLKKGIENIHEVHMYLLAKQAYATLDRLHKVVHKLETELDDATAKKGVMIFEEVVQRISRGAAALLAVVYYLPYEDAKPILDAIGMDPKGTPPSPDQWAQESQQQIAKMLGALKDVTGLTKIDDVLDKIGHSKILPVVATLAVLEPEIVFLAEWAIGKATTTKWKDGFDAKGQYSAKPPKSWSAFVYTAILALAAVGIYKETDGKALDVTEAVLSDFIKLPATPEAAERTGELVGNLFGAIFFNKALYGKGGVFHNYMEEHPILGGSLWGNTKASIIGATITLLLKRYVLLYDRVHAPLKLWRPAGEHAFAGAVRAVEDSELEKSDRAYLTAFHTEEERITLQSIALMMLRIRHVVRQDVTNWVKQQYGDDVMRYQEDLQAFNKLAQAGGVDFHEILGADIEKIAMIYHAAALQLQNALDEICGAVKALMEEFTKGNLSWVQLLASLGIDIGDVHQLQLQLINEAKDELQGFKTGS